MANGDIWELTLHSHHTDQRGIIRRYYQSVNQTGTGPTEAAIATRFDTAFPTPLKNLMGASAIYKGLKIAKVLPLPRQRGTINTVSTGAGAVAGTSLPTQVRGLITLRTAFAGPGFRGRVYVPFPSETDNEPGGVPLGTYVTRLAALGVVLVTTQAAIGVAGNQVDLIPIIWHLPKGVPNLPTNRIPYQVIEAVGRTRWATQRRSGAYGRLNVDEIV